MLSLPLALLSLLPLINAQTTVSLFMPEADSRSFVASVISADATATTYFVECANTTNAASSTPTASSDEDHQDEEDSSECGLSTGITHTQGPSTAAFTASYGAMTMGMSCQLSGTTAAVCTESQNHRQQIQSEIASLTSGSAYASASASVEDDDPEMSTLWNGDIVASMTGIMLEAAYKNVKITAGADKLKAQKPLVTSAGGSSNMAGMSNKTASAGSKATGASTKPSGSAVAKSTGAAGRVDVMGGMGGMGALAIGVATLAL